MFIHFNMVLLETLKKLSVYHSEEIRNPKQ